MQTIAIKDYARLRPHSKAGTPEWIRHYMGRINPNSSNAKYRALGDTEKLAVLLLSELAIQYDNAIPWDKNSLQETMGIAGDINWDSIFAAEEISLIGDKKPPTADEILAERMKVVVKNWNTACEVSPLQPVIRVPEGKSRHRFLLARCKDEVFWERHTEGLKLAVRSAFLCGEPSYSGRKWKLKFDWFIGNGNLHKILEGRYNFEKGKTIYIRRDGVEQYEIPSKVLPSDEIVQDYQGD